MQQINRTKVNNIELEYVKKDDVNYYIYNTSNNRTIIGNQEVVNYLEKNLAVGKDSPLFDFISNKPKFNIFEFNLITFNLSNSYFARLSSFAKVTTNNYIWTLFALITLIFIATSKNLSNFQLNNLTSIPLYVLTVYICGFIIVFFHEFSHFYYYARYFQTSKSKFGFSLRYIFMLLTFINVPFMNAMPIKWQKSLILAGIKTQISISGFLSLIALINPSISNNIYFQIPFFLNIGLIMINILPFFKLDGYWYVSTVLGVSNYMKYFKKMVNKKVPFNIFIFIIGSLNIILILLFIIFSVFRIYLLLR